MTKHTKSLTIIVVLALAIIIIACVLMWGNKYSVHDDINNPPSATSTDSTVQTSDEPAEPRTNRPITVTNLSEGQTVSLPMTVTGLVVGGWFFEGSFPVVVKNAAGEQIGVALATSTENWMTPNKIPFSVTLPSSNYHGAGFVVFTKDNPTGEAKWDMSYSIPVTFR